MSQCLQLYFSGPGAGPTPDHWNCNLGAQGGGYGGLGKDVLQSSSKKPKAYKPLAWSLNFALTETYKVTLRNYSLPLGGAGVKQHTVAPANIWGL